MELDWITIGIMVLSGLAAIVAFLIARSARSNSIAEALNEGCDEEVVLRTQRLNSAVVQAMSHALTGALMPLKDVLPEQRVTPNRDAVAHHDPSTLLREIETSLYAEGDSLSMLSMKIIGLVEKKLLPYVRGVCETTYGGLDEVLRTQGPLLFDVKVGGCTTVGDELSGCCTTCVCICADGIQGDYEDRRRALLKNIQSQWALVLADLGAETPSRLESVVGRNWLASAVTIGAGSAMAASGGSGRPPRPGEFSSVFPELVTNTTEGRLLEQQQQQDRYSPGDAASASPRRAYPIPLSDSDPLPFVIAETDDENYFSCGSVRDDLHAFFQSLRVAVLRSNCDEAKRHYAMFECAQEVDIEAKYWFATAVRYIIDREMTKFRLNFVASGRDVFQREGDSALRRLGAGSQADDDFSEGGVPSASFQNMDIAPGAVEQIKQQVLSEFKAVFDLELAVRETPDVISRCCSHCPPDLPRIRREIPSGEKNVEGAILRKLRYLVMSKFVQERHRIRARQALAPMTRQLLNLLYPESSPFPLAEMTDSFNSAAFRTWRTMIADSVADCTSRLERGIVEGVERRETELAIENIRSSPAEYGSLRTKVVALRRELDPWIAVICRIVTTLKLCHKTSRDICAVGREFYGSFSYSGGNNLRELLNIQYQNIQAIRQYPTFAEWLPMEEIERSFAFHSSRLADLGPER